MLALLVMARLKIPAFPAILIIALMGAVLAIIFQSVLVLELANGTGSEPTALL
ncbi:MAG: Na+/H+ antiporter NhaC [Arenicella sp.]|jgi:Na+/H+ antiporter NhaC